MLLVTLAALAAVAHQVHAADNGVGLRPAMGWNSWNQFATGLTGTLVEETALAMKESGLAALGYEYINLDDSWSLHERKEGKVQYNSTKFPQGLANVTAQIHALGLKAGIYSSAGTLTCGGFMGSLGFETEDATSWAEWGFDYLKYDNCYNLGQSGNQNISFTRYERMSKALNATGRPMIYSICNWGEDWPWDWSFSIANSYRISGDVIDVFDKYDSRCPCTTFDCIGLQGYHCSITNIVTKAAPLGQKNRPGSYGDLDMLEVGNAGLSFVEQISHFSLWSILKSPLILGNDIRNMTEATLSIIANKVMISMNQDSLSSTAGQIWSKDVLADLASPSATFAEWEVKPTTAGSLSLWSGALSDGYVVTLFNSSPKNLTLDVDLAEAFSPIDYGASVSSSPLSVYDVWGTPSASSTSRTSPNATRAEIASKVFGKALGVYCKTLPNITVEAHGVRVFKLTTPVNGTSMAGSVGCASPSLKFEGETQRKMMGRRGWTDVYV